MPLPFFIQFLTPWLDYEPFPNLANTLISKRYQAVLASTDSLTRRLEKLTNAHSMVHLEYQHLQPTWAELPTVWTADYQLISQNEVLIRNAWLQLGTINLVFAHSQLSLTTMDGTTQQAIKRGEHPLGSLFLARDERVERHKLQLAAAQLPLLAKRLALPEHHIFICRRSLFIVAGTPCGRILELFLTDLSA